MYYYIGKRRPHRQPQLFLVTTNRTAAAVGIYQDIFITIIVNTLVHNIMYVYRNEVTSNYTICTTSCKLDNKRSFELFNSQCVSIHTL